MKKYLLLFLFLINGNIYINEIHYDPPGSDNNKEFIEIFHDQEINLTNFTIQDLKSSDFLKQIKFFHSNYSLIVEENFNHTNINASIYSIGKTIGNNLNNDKDAIIFKNNTKIIDVLSYNEKSNGKSLCLIKNKFSSCHPTPGTDNIIEEVKTISTKNYPLLINEILPNPKDSDRALPPKGEWIELYNYGNESIDLTNFEIKDEKNNKILITNLNTLNNTIIQDYLVIYTNGRSIFNNDKDVIYLYKDKIIDKISYEKAEEEISFSRFNKNFKKTKPTPNSKNKQEIKKLKEKLKIKSVLIGSDKKANFGDNLIVNFQVSRQSHRDRYVSLYFENLSKKLKIKVPNKFTNYSFSLPVQLTPNCNHKLPSGYYNLILKGFDLKTSTPIKVEGNSTLCKTEKIYIEKQKTAVSASSKNKNIETLIKAKKADKIIYTDKNKTIFRGSIYVFSGLLILLMFYIIKNEKSKSKSNPRSSRNTKRTCR